MFVLMDMEWYEDQAHWFITQVSALRIDENYIILDQCDTLVSPSSNSNPETIRWGDISFSGWTKKNYILAPDINAAFTKLYNWLKPDDILVWWHKSGEDKFVTKIQLMDLPFRRSRVICKQVRNLIPGVKRNGSPSALCLAYGIPVSVPEHCSSADVHTLRNLLAAVRFPLASLGEDNWKEQFAQTRGSIITNLKATAFHQKHGCRNQYFYDKKTRLLHKASCPDCNTQSFITEISLSKAVVLRLTPCSCCRKQYTNDIIESSVNPPQASIVYSTKARGSIAHYSNCPVVKRISRSNLRTIKSAEHARDTGFHFCKTCSSIERFYNPLRPFVESFCTSYRLRHYIKNNSIHVVSQFDRWQIVIDEDTGIPALYHKNKGRHKDGPTASSVPGYHPQPKSAHTIPGILRNIANHDRYRGSIPFVEFPKKPKKNKENSKKDRQAGPKKKKKSNSPRLTKADLDDAILDYYE